MCNDVAIPKPDAFRKWVIEVSRSLDLSPYQWSLGAGIGQNGLSKFITEKQQDLRLETASLIVEHASKVATRQGKILPLLPTDIAKATVPELVSTRS